MKKFSLLSVALLGLAFFPNLNQAKAANITFEVDMTGYTPSVNGVHVTGSINNWSPSANAMAPAGNNIFTATLVLADNTYYEFKFVNDNDWPGQEVIPAEAAISNNRYIFTGTGNATIRYAFNGMPITGAGLSKVTFNVDLSAVTASEPVRLVGTLTNWNPNTCPMKKVGATSVYTRDMYIRTDLEHEYKFINGGTDWANIEQLTGLPCANGSNNRTMTATGATASVSNTFNACDLPTDIKTTKSAELTTYPNPVVNTLFFDGLTEDAQVTIINGVGSVVLTANVESSNASIDLNNLPTGLYLVQISSNNNTTVKKITKQ